MRKRVLQSTNTHVKNIHSFNDPALVPIIDPDKDYFNEIVDIPGGAFDTFSISAADVNGDGVIDFIVGDLSENNEIIPFDPCPGTGGA